MEVKNSSNSALKQACPTPSAVPVIGCLKLKSWTVLCSSARGF